MEQENGAVKCECAGDWKNPKTILMFSLVVLVSAIIIVSILRERIVSENEDIVTVMGRGKVSYQPDIAVVTLGVQVDKAPKAEDALSKLNESMNRIIASAKALDIPEEDIQTQSYSLFPHYDFQGEGGGTSIPSGYDANQQVTIKTKNIDENPVIVSKVIEEVSKAGANQVVGVSFDVSNLEELKQKARIEAISDARSKSSGIAKAAGVEKLGKVTSWYENIIKSPDVQSSYDGGGMGGALAKSSANVPSPQIPSGTEEIIIEMGLNYRIK